MAKAWEILEMLIPQEFLHCEPITKAQFEAGFSAFDAWKAEQDAAKAAEKTALLARLGITNDEAKLLLS